MTGADTLAIVEFGRYKLLPLRRELVADGKTVELGARAFDLLMVLVEASGRVVSKDELIERVWPGRVIEENNLQVQIAALRKAFAADRDLVRTVPGRGYQFSGEIRIAKAPARTASAAPRNNLPGSPSELIGRDAEVREITDLVELHRLVTLVGAGGIGKTRLSLEVARQLLPDFPDGVWVVELAPLSDPQLLPVTVAMALGLTLPAGPSSPQGVAAELGGKQVLVLLDNCEHVIDAAARMAQALLRANAVSCVMATSREPLRTPGEYVYRVSPLDVPAEGTQDARDLLSHGAVQLFVTRARAVDRQFEADAQAAATIGAICRRLDGIPLAIELAAARGPVLGVEEVAARLDDRFRLLTGGLRTALPRQQTLRATLDWSYGLLTPPERLVLCRLAIFVGTFTLESAGTVVGEALEDKVLDCVVELVAKSLLIADITHANAVYRLGDTTRAYAFVELAKSGELDQIARRHALYHRDLLERAQAAWNARAAEDWPSGYGRLIDDLRAALDWAFSANGDGAVGVALTAAAVPIWMQFSLIEECRDRVEQALSRLQPDENRDWRRKMQLLAALGGAQLHTRSPGPEITAAWTAALEIAERLDDTDYRLRALWGLWLDRLNHGEFRNALALAERFARVAETSTDSVDRPIGERLIGLTQHYLGDQLGARRHFERMLDQHLAPAHRSYMIRFQFDQWATARLVLATILWIQGRADQALHAMKASIEEALANPHPLSLSNVLAKACPIAILAGDLATTERLVAMLLDHSARHGLTSWHAEGRCFEGILLIKRGSVSDGLQRLRTALDELWRPSSGYTGFLSELAQGLGAAGEIAAGLATIDKALVRSELSEERWCISELLRVKGELVLFENAADAPTIAERLFLEGTAWAQRQGALSWELRCTTSLARLLHATGRTDHARGSLLSVYGKLTEGFDTADPRAAKRLLDMLS